jgi:lipopolysaccharide export LptBFGC system permease protein LptF
LRRGTPLVGRSAVALLGAVLLVAVYLVLVFGLGTLLEAAFWTLLLIAAAVAVVVLLAGRAVTR